MASKGQVGVPMQLEVTVLAIKVQLKTTLRPTIMLEEVHWYRIKILLFWNESFILFLFV